MTTNCAPKDDVLLDSISAAAEDNDFLDFFFFLLEEVIGVLYSRVVCIVFQEVNMMMFDVDLYFMGRDEDTVYF